MIPALRDGDLVFFKIFSLNKSILKVGDIVIFNHPHKKIRLIKRIKSINKFSIEVSGDNKNASNDSKLFGAIQKEKIIGIVTSRVSYKFMIDIKNVFNL